MLTPAAAYAQFQRARDQSLLIYFGHQITLEAHRSVRKLLRLLETQPIAGVRNFHPRYCSLLVKFDPLKLQHPELEAVMREYLNRLERVRLPKPRQIEIPVCYGGEYGPDLDDVSALHGITPAETNELHS